MPRPYDPKRPRKRLAAVLAAAPLLIGFPVLWEGLQDPASIARQWDVWLIFFALPIGGAIILWLTIRRD